MTEPLTKEIAPPDETLRAAADAIRHAITARIPPGERTAVDTRRPCEPVYYLAKDGKHVCLLGDGTVLLIGNQMAPSFDNPGEISHYGRDPLMVSVSADGYRFTRAYALRCGKQAFRVARVDGRGGGGQYPSAVVHDGRLHVAYSMGKEDIWICSVPLSDLGIAAR